MPLGHAWAQRVADEIGVRILMIKGPVPALHGLRPRRVSGDVDVLVEPAGFDRFVSALEDAGWRERPATFASARFTLHSRSLIRDTWPCDIDVHSCFPGFLADPTVVFEALWARRVQVDLAHQSCDAPDRLGSALILALHCLRGGSTDRRYAAELDFLVDAFDLTSSEEHELAALASRTGCEQTLRTVLTRMGVAPDALRTDAGSDRDRAAALQEWERRVVAGGGAYYWLAAFRRAGARERVVIAARALWPSDRDLLLNHPEISDALAPKLGARVRRYGRGLKSVPAAVRALAVR